MSSCFTSLRIFAKSADPPPPLTFSPFRPFFRNASSPTYRIDGSAKPLADELRSCLPGLRGAPQSFGIGTPSGVNWIHANDHFVCRKAHSIPLAADFNDDGECDDAGGRDEAAEAALNALAVPVSSHLAWRFREWYRCPRLLSAVAGPPFREVHDGMVRAASSNLGHDDRGPFVLYSCHDVTLLALLYALGADFLASGDDCGGADMRDGGEEGGEDPAHYSGMTSGRVRRGTRRSSWRWWPPYSSTIAFELVRLDGTGVDKDQFVIRVILNGETLRLIPRMSVDDDVLMREQPSSSREVFGEMTADGKCKMMRLSDFDRIINVLEEVSDQGSSLSNVDPGSIGGIGVDGG